MFTIVDPITITSPMTDILVSAAFGILRFAFFGVTARPEAHSLAPTVVANQRVGDFIVSDHDVNVFTISLRHGTAAGAVTGRAHRTAVGGCLCHDSYIHWL